jgi:hypothetical protein
LITGYPVFARCVTCVVLLAFTTACATTRPITATDTESLASQFAIGDKIEVERNDGSRLQFKVTEVSPDGLRGEKVFVPFKEIRNVQVIEPMQPAIVALLVLLGATALYVLIEGEACGDYAWQTPCDDYGY